MSAKATWTPLLITILLMLCPEISELRAAVTGMRPPEVPTFRQFMLSELVIPDGKWKGFRFKIERQPAAGLFIDEVDSGRWNEYYCTAPSQWGKSLLCFVAPMIYHTVGLRETYIFACPDLIMGNDKWKKDVIPVFQASNTLRPLLPRKGPGSVEGNVKDGVQLGGGCGYIKFMTKGGSDTSKAGFTSRAIGMTEAAAFSRATSTSKEADPFRQIAARQRAYKRAERATYVEGTLTVEEELPFSGHELSSQSVIVCPCPHCREWIAPDRENLIGVEDARTPEEAAEIARFFCYRCGEMITEDERRDMNQACRLIHRGQRVLPSGEIEGEPPNTSRLWFQVLAFNNLFLDTSDLAADESRAQHAEPETEQADNLEREACQFVWCRVYTPRGVDDTELDVREVRKRTDSFRRSIIPSDTTHLTLGIDCGKWTSWWLLLAFREGKLLHVPAYGALDVCTDTTQDVEVRLLQALLEFYETVEEGWPVAGEGSMRVPDRVWIDWSYKGHIVHQFLRKIDQTKRKARWRTAMGRGQSQLERFKYVHPARTDKTEIRQLGNNWHLRWVRSERCHRVVVNADYWKERLHEHLAIEKGKPGGLTFYAPEGTRDSASLEHAKVARHLTAEKKVAEFVEGRGMVWKWVKTGANHWLDCAYNALAAGGDAGFTMTEQQSSSTTHRGSWYG